MTGLRESGVSYFTESLDYESCCGFHGRMMVSDVGRLGRGWITGGLCPLGESTPFCYDYFSLLKFWGTAKALR